MYKNYTKTFCMPPGCISKLLLIMKLTTFILIISLMQVSASTFGQRVTLKQNNLSIDKVIYEIRKQTGYDVLMEYDHFKGLKINANFNKASLSDVMDAVVKGTGLTYSIEDKNIVVKKEDPSIIKQVLNYFVNINVEGRVIDAELDRPLYGVNITLKGTRRMVTTKDFGKFVFNGLPDGATLIVSCIGYVTQEVKAHNNMLIKMVPSSLTLSDVTVSTGYQTLKQSSATGSYNVITAKELETNPSVNLMQRLEGKVPGVMFDVRGNTIQIRGSNTYASNSPPLIVIDGFPAVNQKLTNITGNYNDGNPQFATQTSTSGNAILSTFNIADIESVTFLKDAAASAIWGANAANGVIVITTKKGKKGPSAISFGSTFSISAPANFNNLTSMSSKEYIGVEQELFDRNYLTDPYAYVFNKPVTQAEDLMFQAKRGMITANQRDAGLNQLASQSNLGQIKEYLLQKAITQQQNLSLSGGSDNTTYYISGSYVNDRPVFKSNNSESYSLTSNLTNDFLNKRLTISTGFNYTYAKTQVNSAALQALSSGMLGLAPYDMLVDENGNKIYKGITFKSSVGDDYTKKGYLPWNYNPIDELSYNNSIERKNSFRFNTNIKGVITDWLNITLSGQLQKGITNGELIEDQNSFKTRDFINTGTTTSPTGALVYNVPLGAIYKTQNVNNNDYGVRGQLNINKTWNDKHHFDMIAGTEIRESTFRGSNQVLYGYDKDRSTSVNVNTLARYTTIYGYSQSWPSTQTGTVYRDIKRYFSEYANAGYSYLDKYFISGSVRFDDINILGVDRRDRAKPLWSGGLRWDMKKEDFLQNVKWLSDLSLRATLGTGGTPPSTSNNYATINTGSDVLTGLPTSSILTYANPEIGWSTTKMTNFGLDAGLFSHRLNFTLEVYRKKTTGLLMQVPINSAYGTNLLYYNAGDLSGRGVDLGLTGQVVRSKDWTWSQTLNFSYNVTDVTDNRFPNKSVLSGTAIVTGYPVDNLFVYHWAGLDNTGHSQIYNASGTVLTSRGTTQVKPGDLIYAGRTTPPYFGGYFNTVRYKDLSLLVNVSYMFGHKFLMQNIDASKYPTFGAFSGLISSNKALVNRWEKPGDEAFTSVPGLLNPDANSVNWYSGADINVRDAGNIRLQQVALNYTLPKALLKGMPFIKALNFGFTVSNLGVLWVANKEGIDPLYQNTDSYTNLPPSRNYVFNLNLSL